MAIIDNIELNGEIVYPITATHLLYDDFGQTLLNKIGNIPNQDINGTLNQYDSNVKSLSENLTKTGTLIDSLNSKGLSLSKDSTPEIIVESINNATVNVSYPIHTINGTEMGTSHERTSRGASIVEMSQIDVINMSNSDREVLGNMLGITVNADTVLYVYEPTYTIKSL